MCLVSLSHTHSLVGQFEQAFVRSREALEMATEMERPYDLSYAHAAQGLAHLTVSELDKAICHLEEASRISRAYEIMLLVPHATRYLARAYALAGKLDEAEKLLVEAVQQTRSQSLAALWGWCSATLGFTRALAGERGEAKALLNEVLEFAHGRGYRPLEAHTLRLIAVIEAAGCDHAENTQSGEQWFHNAASLARKIGMKPELAHCHQGLGDLLANTRRAAEARGELRTALELYSSMGMVRDVAMVNASLAALEGSSKPNC